MPYATFAQYTAVYSVPGVVQSVTETFIARAGVRLEEALGAFYTTPFSSNNQTAIELTIDIARWMLQLRTSKQDDSKELGSEIENRIKELRSGMSTMATTSGAAIEPSNAANTAWSTTKDFKGVFDMRDAPEQRIDPELLDDLDNRDTP